MKKLLRAISLPFLLILLVISFTVQPVNAEPLEFFRITSNSSTNVEGQLSVAVSDPGSGQVLFTVSNNETNLDFDYS